MNANAMWTLLKDVSDTDAATTTIVVRIYVASQVVL